MGSVLLEHNVEPYNLTVKSLDETNKTCVIEPTGLGKSYLAFQLAVDNPDKSFAWFGPSRYTFDNTASKFFKQYPSESLDNLKFGTYAQMIKQDESVLADLECDYIILDEFHHLGAEKWGRAVQTLLDTHPDSKVFGLTATPVRTDARDMAKELFENNVAYKMELVEAWERGLLPVPELHLGTYEIQRKLDEQYEKINALEDSDFKVQSLIEYNRLKALIPEAEGLPEIFKEAIKNPTGKYLFFVSSEESMKKVEGELKDWLKDINENIDVYSVHSNNPDGNKELAAFNENKSASSLKICLSIDQLAEGIHLPDIDGEVMLRSTISEIVFKQQLGRILDHFWDKEHAPVLVDLVNNTRDLALLENSYLRFADEVNRSTTQPAAKPKEEISKATETNSKKPFSSFKVFAQQRDMLLAIEALEERLKTRHTRVTCYETGEVFENATAAAKSVGLKFPSAIRKAIRNHTISAGYHWYYESDEINPELFKEAKAKPVVCYETGEVFENGRKAAESFGLKSPASIHQAIKRNVSAGGYHWYYEGDEINPELFKKAQVKPVVCYETGEVFENGKLAAESFGLKSPASIHRAIKRKATAGGYHWYYADQPKPDPSEFRKGLGKPVVCYETGERFESVAKAGEAVGLNVGTMHSALRNKHSAAGYHWYYADEPKPDPSEFKNPVNREIVCYETGEVFESVAAAARKTGCTEGSIRNAANKGHKAREYHWYFADEPKPDPVDLKKAKSRAVVCYETGEVFESAVSAGETMNIHGTTVSAACKTKGTAGGYHWYYEGDEISSELFKKAQAKPVVCYETGEIFENGRKAAESVGLKSPSAISKAIKNHTTSGGYHWYYEGDEISSELFKKAQVKPVVCYETGEVFESREAVAKATGVSNHTIRRAIESNKVITGYHFEYADSSNLMKQTTSREIPAGIGGMMEGVDVVIDQKGHNGGHHHGNDDPGGR